MISHRLACHRSNDSKLLHYPGIRFGKALTLCSYVFTGLGHLMESMLISNARLLRLPNDYGIKKMMRNMLALQQSIKTLTNDQQLTEFERAKQYYSLYNLSPQVS